MCPLLAIGARRAQCKLNSARPKLCQVPRQNAQASKKVSYDPKCARCKQKTPAASDKAPAASCNALAIS